MGTITNFIRMAKNGEIKNIFTYTSGKGTVNRIIVSDINNYIARLLNSGWAIV